MSQLIEDLLNLSQVTRRDVKREKICLSHFAIAISEELRSTEPQRKVKWSIAENVYAQAIPACYVSF